MSKQKNFGMSVQVFGSVYTGSVHCSGQPWPASAHVASYGSPALHNTLPYLPPRLLSSIVSVFLLLALARLYICCMLH